LPDNYFDLAQGPGLHDPDDVHAVRAAVLIAEGRAAEARLDMDLVEQKLVLKPPAIAPWMREDIDELRARSS
jgi:hypothetical protein